MIAAPLTQHMGEKNPRAVVPWGKDEQKAFDEIRERLITAPVLAHPDYNKRFILQTDACGYGIGAVLSQTDDDRKEHPIAFLSRTLTKAEMKWTVHEREALAIVWACEQFRPYLAHSEFTLRVETDHSNLRYMSNATSPPRLARWGVRMSEFSFELVYKKGLHNKSDALSRAPLCRTIQDAMEAQKSSKIECKPQMTRDEVKAHWGTAQGADPLLNDILMKLKAGGVVEEKKLKRGQRRGSYMRDEDGLLRLRAYGMEYWDERDCPLVVPRSMVSEVIREFHDHPLMGHLGAKKTYHRLAERFYWLKMRTDISRFTQGCMTCREYKSTPPRGVGILQPFLAVEPFLIVHCDFIGPLPVTRAGYRYVCVFIDKFSRWVEVVPTQGCTAKDMADALIDVIISRHGCPERLVTDRGSCFTAALSQRLFQRLGIHHILTTAYNPQANAQVERVNRVLKAVMQTICRRADEWDRNLQIAAFAYRTSYIDSVRTTPFQVLYGRKARLPSDLVFGKQVAEHLSLESYGEELSKRLQKVWYQARAAQWLAKQQMMQAQTRKDRAFEKGSVVLTWKGSIQPHEKLARFGESKVRGPWTVVQELSPVLYQLERVAKNGKKVKETFHVNKMIPYEEYAGPVADDVTKKPQNQTKVEEQKDGLTLPAMKPTEKRLSETIPEEKRRSRSVPEPRRRERFEVSPNVLKKELQRVYPFPDDRAREKTNAAKKIDKIEDHRTTRGRGLQYKVLWGTGKMSWEYERDLTSDQARMAISKTGKMVTKCQHEQART